MKKLLSLFSALALSAFAIAATSVSMDFSNPADYGFAVPDAGKYTQIADGNTIAKDNVVLTVNFTTGSGFRFYNSNGKINLRGYKDAKLTISAPANKKLLKVQANGSNLTSAYMSGDMTSELWSGEADKLEINIIQSTVQINTLNVEYGDAGEAPAQVDTVTVKEALARFKEGKTGECYIKGKVSQIMSNNVEQYGNISYWMHDSENANDSIQAYRMKGADNKPYTSSADIEFVVGDVILVYAAGLQEYQKDASSPVIIEAMNGYYVRTISGKPSEKLDWAAGLAVRFEDHWQLEIAKTDGDTKNILILKFGSDLENSIKGHHYLAEGSSIAINGSDAAITSGFVQLTFKEISTSGYNVYATQVSAITADKVYTLAENIEFMAVRDDYETEIDLDGDRPFVPIEGQEITCEEARSYALSLPAGTTGDITVTVHGFVTDLFSNGITFWMADKKGSEKVFQSYLSVLPLGVALANDAEVKVTGKVTNYNGTPEISKGNVEVISGGGVVTVLEVNVAEAIAACQALAQNATSTEVYAITGFIINIARDYSEQYGNISFWMSDNASDEKGDFEAYNVKCDATLAAKLLPGAKVKVTDKLKHFHQDAKPAEGDQPEKPERTVYETNGGGTVELLQGAGVEDIMSDAAVVKFIQNGQLYIIRNNAIYNVQGQQVK